MQQFLLIISYFVGNLLRIPLVSNVDITLVDLTVLGIFGYYIPHLWRNRLQLWRSIFFKSTLLFIAATLLSLLIALQREYVSTFEETLVGFLYLIRLIAYAGLFFTPINISRKTIYVIIGGYSIIALCQYVFYPDLRNLLYLGWDEHYFRLFGSLLDPNFTGILSVMFLWTVILDRQLNLNKKSVIAAILLMVLLFTYSRSAYIVFTLTGLLYGLRQRSVLIPVVVFTALIIGIGMLPKNLPSEGTDIFRTASIDARIDEIERAVKISQKYPFTGVGYNLYRYARNYHYPNLNLAGQDTGTENNIPSRGAAGVPNSYAFILNTTGIIGLGAFVFWLYNQYVVYKNPNSYGSRSSSGATRMLVIYFIYIISGIFDNSMVYPFIFLWPILTAKNLKIFDEI